MAHDSVPSTCCTVMTELESGSLLKTQLTMTFLTKGRLLDSNLKEPSNLQASEARVPLLRQCMGAAG